MGRMLDIRERTRLRRILYAKPTIILLGLLVAVLIHSTWGVYQKSKDAITKHAKAEEELTGLLAREKELSEDITRLGTAGGIEAEIRERFMVAKEGEKVMIIADPSKEDAHTVIVTENTPSFLQSLMSVAGLGGQ